MKFRYDENPNTLEFWNRYYKRRTVERKLIWLFPEALKILNKYPPEANALEIGCGNGRTVIELWKLRKSVLWTGLDFSDASIGNAKRKYKKYAKWRCADICDLTKFGRVEPTYDFILCAETLEHLTRPMVACELMWSLLKTAGTILITVPVAGTALDKNPLNLHHVTYQPDDFGTMFPNYLAHVETFQIDKHHLGAVIRKELDV